MTVRHLLMQCESDSDIHNEQLTALLVPLVYLINILNEFHRIAEKL